MYNAQAIDASLKVSSTLVLLNIAHCHIWGKCFFLCIMFSVPKVQCFLFGQKIISVNFYDSFRYILSFIFNRF